jgi:hypothetical protein
MNRRFQQHTSRIEEDVSFIISDRFNKVISKSQVGSRQRQLSSQVSVMELNLRISYLQSKLVPTVKFQA